jgi:hypothetical protein
MEKVSDKYGAALQSCALIRIACSEEDRLALISRYGEPSVSIPEFRSDWQKEGVEDPFANEIEYAKDESGEYEKPACWKMGWYYITEHLPTGIGAI